jgi:alpha-beta hydrolase superfamily lysophospholipase
MKLQPRHPKRWLLLLLALFLASCAPLLKAPGPAMTEPAIVGDALLMADGMRLPLRAWPAESAPTAVILALHGFNDYGTFIKAAAEYWRQRGVQVYAYDQRGFGEAPATGLWPGSRALADDLAAAAKLLRGRHAGVPFYILGMSMGGAVTMTAFAKRPAPGADGVILVAPAVWGRSTMPFYQRWALWLAAHTVPWLKLSGRGLNIKPSDNVEMLRALGRDPLVIKETRIDTSWGLVNLMDAALASASRFRSKALILYGEKDEVIRKAPTERMLAQLPARAGNRQRLMRYDSGYHMLLRDLAGERVWKDILAWVKSAPAAGTGD